MPDQNLSGEFILTKPENTTSTPVVPKPETPAVSAPAPKSTESHPHEHNKPHFFSSFCYYPKGFRFKNQEADEEVVILVRQHYITNVPWIVGVILLALIPPVVYLFGPYFIPPLSISPILILLSTVFYYVALFSLALLYFTVWYFNVGIVTNKRLIDLDVHNILTRVLSEARLNAIQDISVTQVGGIPSIFNYGNVDIQTEGTKQNLEFYRIPQPNFIRTIIGNLVVNRK